MNRFTFFLNIEGHGDTPQEAWEDAMGRVFENAKEFQTAPEQIFQKDEEIPAADILSGALPEFGIDHGPDELEGEDDQEEAEPPDFPD